MLYTCGFSPATYVVVHIANMHYVCLHSRSFKTSWNLLTCHVDLNISYSQLVVVSFVIFEMVAIVMIILCFQYKVKTSINSIEVDLSWIILAIANHYCENMFFQLHPSFFSQKITCRKTIG